jgi:hypothetical protein
MISLTVTPDATQNKISVLENAKHTAHADEIAIGGIPNGMESGLPSVVIALDLGQGTVAVAKTSLALLLSTADALKAKYGDPRI